MALRVPTVVLEKEASGGRWSRWSADLDIFSASFVVAVHYVIQMPPGQGDNHSTASIGL